MPIRWDSKILLAKIEASYGTDPTPTGAANAMLVTNVEFKPMEGQDISRELDLPWLAAQATIPAGLHSQISFRVELVGSGTPGTAPAWGPLLRACAVAQTVSAGVSVIYNPVSEGHESVTLHFWVGGTRYVMIGARGTGLMRFNAQGIPYVEMTLWGLFSMPSEQARPTPTLTAFQKPVLVTKANTPTFTIGGTALVMRNFSLDLGNRLMQRLLVGAEYIWIENRAEKIAATVEAVPLSTYDPYAVAASQGTQAVSLVHGTVAGKIATLGISTAQMQRPSGLVDAQSVTEWPLGMIPLPVAGNDQWTLTLT